MASLDRAYGLRGAVISLAMTTVAGGVHGVLAWQFDFLATKVFTGLCCAVLLVMAGAISARRSLATALGLGLVMGLVFFLARWTGWSVMDAGADGVFSFFAAAPFDWPIWLAARGISTGWIVEAASLTTTALFACYVGHERAESSTPAPATAASGTAAPT